MRRDTAPVLEAASSMLQDYDSEGTKVLRDARLTLAQTGRAAGQVERALPTILGDVERIAQDSDRDNFMGAAKSVEYGLVDTVLDKRLDVPVRA